MIDPWGRQYPNDETIINIVAYSYSRGGGTSSQLLHSYYTAMPVHKVSPAETRPLPRPSPKHFEGNIFRFEDPFPALDFEIDHWHFQ
jgi:hypothetical protein